MSEAMTRKTPVSMRAKIFGTYIIRKDGFTVLAKDALQTPSNFIENNPIIMEGSPGSGEFRAELDSQLNMKR